MSVNVMALVFAANMPELKTDDGKTVPDTTAKFVLLAMADNASEDGENCYSGIRKLCQKTNFSTATVCNALNALRNNGFLELVGKSKVDTNNYTINISRLQRLKFQPLKQDDSSGYNPSVLAAKTEPSVNHQIKPSYDEISKPDEPKPAHQILGIEASIYQGRETTDEDLPNYELREKAAIAAFEQALNIPANWNWYPAKSTEEKTWRDFRLYILKAFEADSQCFAKYNTWRDVPYQKNTMSNLQIKRNPENFPTSWVAFLASSAMAERQTDPSAQYRPRISA